MFTSRHSIVILEVIQFPAGLLRGWKILGLRFYRAYTCAVDP